MFWQRIFKSRFTLAAILVIAIFQINVLRTQDDFIGKPRWKDGRVITWDVQEYYMYLPAAFIYNDPAFTFLDTMKGPQLAHFWTGKSPSGKRVGRFSIGMAVVYAPFFFLSDEIAKIAGATRDGFSQPYQFGLYVSGFLYSLIGFLFLGMALRQFYKDHVTALTLICIGLGTNLFYYSTSEGAMTHSILFCLCAVYLYFTIRWHHSPRLKFILPLVFVFGLAVLIRPTSILISLVFLFYGVYNKVSFREKIQFFLLNLRQLFIALGFLILLALPQMIYWKQQTGSLIYYSYTGERFFFMHPHIWDGLLSYRKGWLIYTPIVSLFLLGLFFVRRYVKELFIPVTLFMVLNIYVVLSWWCWWYGGGFGLRAFIESYVFLAMPLAALWRWGMEKGMTATAWILIIAGIFIRINLFQSRQYREGMLHWDSMSKAMYMETFMKLGYVKDADKVLITPDYDAAKKGEPEKGK